MYLYLKIEIFILYNTFPYIFIRTQIKKILLFIKITMIQIVNRHQICHIIFKRDLE